MNNNYNGVEKMKITKKIPTISALMMFIISLVAPIILATPAYAVSVNEVMPAPSGWGTPTGPVLAYISAAGDAALVPPATDTSIALRNAPSIHFNPSLDTLPLAQGTDGGVHESGAFPISSSVTTCPDLTPVTVTFGSSTSTIIDISGANPNVQGFNNTVALLDMSGPAIRFADTGPTGNDIDDIDTFDGGSYVTTFGNLSNLYAVANIETVQNLIDLAPLGSQGYSVVTIPQVTLSYDNADCPIAPVVSNASVAKTIVSPDTASGAVVVQGSSYGASDANGDTLTYSITAGNGAGYFEIDPDTGDITSTRANVPAGTYTLTVLIDDGNGGTTTATVTITVTESGLASTGDNSNIYMALTSMLFVGSAFVLRKRFAHN